jgi:hypothetical protein
MVGTPPALGSGHLPILLFHWVGDKCTATFFYNGLATKIPAADREGGVEIYLDSLPNIEAPSKFKIISQKIEWSLPPVFDFAEVDSNVQILFVPACGLEGSSWIDGWMGHLHSNSGIYSFVPAGGMARILIATDISTAASLPVTEVLESGSQVETNRQCVVAALRAKFQDKLLLPICIEDRSRHSALAAVLFQQAFPQQTLQFIGDIPKKLLPRPWKGLLDALSATYVESSGPALSLEDIYTNIPAHLVEALFEHINGPTRIFDYREWNIKR